MADKVAGYIVAITDTHKGGAYYMPCGPDPECEGTLTPSDYPTLFATRKDALHAIKTSKAWAKVKALQTPELNHEGDDWTPSCGLQPLIQAVYAPTAPEQP